MENKKTPMQVLHEKYSKQQAICEDIQHWHTLEELLSLGRQVAKETATNVK